MEEILDVRNINIPDGVLHDRKLRRASFLNGELTLEFNIEIYEQDYIDKSYCERYKNYKSCFVTAKVDDTSCCMFYGNNKDRITGKYTELA